MLSNAIRTDFRAIQTKAASEGDVATLVESVEGTVRTIAAHFGRGLSKTDQEDICAAGRMGAVKAATRYEYERGASFNTYATYWIRAHIVYEVFSLWSRGRCKITRATAKVFFQRGKAQRALEADGIDATPEAVAKLLGIPADVLESVTAPTAGLVADVADESADTLATLCDRASVDKVRSALSLLDARARYVVTQRYFEDESHSEIGAALHLSKQRVQKIEEEALAVLRNSLS